MVFTNTNTFAECGVSGMAVTRVGKSNMRRFKANARERNRMHSLNAALDRLRTCIPVHTITVGSKPGNYLLNS